MPQDWETHLWHLHALFGKATFRLTGASRKNPALFVKVVVRSFEKSPVRAGMTKGLRRANYGFNLTRPENLG